MIDLPSYNSYTVAKLKDGKCWMTQNLRLYVSSLTPEDSDISSQVHLNLFEADDYKSLFESRMWNGCGGTEYLPAGRKKITGEVYYDWLAACAGTGKWNTGEGYECSSTICPRGWTIPTIRVMDDLKKSDADWFKSLKISDRTNQYGLHCGDNNPKWGQIGTSQYIWLKNGGTSSASSHIDGSSYPNSTGAYSSDAASVTCMTQ